MVHSPDGNTNSGKWSMEVLLRDTMAPYLFLFCEYYALGTSIDIINEMGSQWNT